MLSSRPVFNQIKLIIICLPLHLAQVRVWEISESRVVAVASLHGQDMVTAAAFSPDGSRVLVGTMRGKCKFYDYTDGSTLDYVAQVRGGRLGSALAAGAQLRLQCTSQATLLLAISLVW